ncbi:MAG: polyprenyl synthetase family protein [Verrucomicrobia bacterium]|nr:polyprenyl synthetase family protein [Verrucomicrobiota bacterium]
MDLPRELKRRVALVEAGLARHVPSAETRPSRLHAAMRYSLEAGGKRVRPVLVLAAAELCGAAPERALPAAVAIECVHTYSLIHDDLPCLDNDDLRRGRPTAHKAFDEATALLAGDALLTHAFALLAQAHAAEAGLAHALIRELADAAGSQRLIGGQMEDVLAEEKADATAAELEFIHLNKTAAMLEASLVMGGLVAGAPASALGHLRTTGRELGLAFQIVDDVLDATADSATLGKTAGKDARAGKTTYVRLHGIEASQRMAAEHTRSALSALAQVPGDRDFLTALIEALVHRAA